MAILIISSNPLLVEAISETLSRSLRSKLHSAPPEDALQCIQAIHPQVILVDNAIPPALLGEILVYAQSLRKSHLILLNNSSNNFIFLDSYQANIDTVEDLVRAIQIKELENGNHRPENEQAKPTGHKVER